jgi:hypothetical protein
MSAMLGEMLLKVGALTEAQLQQVLHAQSIYGGRLGTNLVEMGLVEEEDLARVLNEKMGVPHVELADLHSVPGEILSLVPFEMVQRYRVLPVAVKGKKLTLAMEDPSDFSALDDIGFVTGLVVVPRVCSELRLALALERYYGIKRTLRYIPVQGGFSSRFQAGSARGTGACATERDAASQPSAQKDTRRRSRRVTIASLAETFSKAAGELEVVSALLGHLGGEFDRAAFLGVQPGVVLGVKAVVAGEPVDGFAGFSCLLEGGSPLGRLVEERQLFLGELPADGPEGGLVKALGGEAPTPGLVVPLSVDGQLAAVVCVVDEHGRLAGGVFELRRVIAMAELTFVMIRLRKRIRAC